MVIQLLCSLAMNSLFAIIFIKMQIQMKFCLFIKVRNITNHDEQPQVFEDYLVIPRGMIYQIDFTLKNTVLIVEVDPVYTPIDTGMVRSLLSTLLLMKGISKHQRP